MQIILASVGALTILVIGFKTILVFFAKLKTRKLFKKFGSFLKLRSLEETTPANQTTDTAGGTDYVCIKCNMKKTAQDRARFFTLLADHFLSNKQLMIFVSLAFTSIGLIAAASVYLDLVIFEETAEGRYIAMAVIFPTIIAIGFIVQTGVDKKSVNKKVKDAKKELEVQYLKELDDLKSDHEKVVSDKDQKILKLETKLTKKPSGFRGLNPLKKKSSI